MIRETEQSEGSVSDDEELANQSIHIALQDKQSGDTYITTDHVMIM